MKNHLSDYEQKIFDFLNRMKLNNVAEINKWSKVETREQFISAIKKYIDLYGTIEFNSDYTKIKRIQSWQEMEEDWKDCTSDTRRKINKERERKQKLNKQHPPTEDMWAKIKGK